MRLYTCRLPTIDLEGCPCGLVVQMLDSHMGDLSSTPRHNDGDFDAWFGFPWESSISPGPQGCPFGLLVRILDLQVDDQG